MARRWAVLIDAENVAADVADPLFTLVETWGDACVRRMYGDFDGRQAPWKAKRQIHHIETIQLSNMVQGKNGADIALVIDAMDLMGRGHLDGFCLVTSDCDFTRLAWRLRGEGKAVKGVGRAGAAEAFRAAFGEFVAVEALLAPAATFSTEIDRHSAFLNTLSPKVAIDPLIRALEITPRVDGWAHLGTLGANLLKVSPKFSLEVYGMAKLSDLVRATGAFAERTTKGGIEIALLS
jgi:hypothetical protein